MYPACCGELDPLALMECALSFLITAAACFWPVRIPGFKRAGPTFFAITCNLPSQSYDFVSDSILLRFYCLCSSAIMGAVVLLLSRHEDPNNSGILIG
jgi:hypothetical protein